MSCNCFPTLRTPRDGSIKNEIRQAFFVWLVQRSNSNSCVLNSNFAALQYLIAINVALFFYAVVGEQSKRELSFV